MDTKRLLKQIIVLMIFMFVANHLAAKFHWYYSISWFDMLMHFLGGVWVALFFLYVFKVQTSFARKFLIVISSVLVVGLLWELFEFGMGIIAGENFSISDTLSDIFFDLTGGYLAILAKLKHIMPTRENKV